MGSMSKHSIERFVRYVTLGETPARARVLVPDAPRIEHSMRDREIYSYGRHFPLCRYVPARGNVPAMWLVNGDRWRGGGWSSTGRHQEETRAAIADVIADAAKLGKRVDTFIVPFSALDGAGIDRDSVRPLFVRDDRTETFRNTAKVPASVFAAALPTHADADAESRLNHSVPDDSTSYAVHSTRTLAQSLALAVTNVSDDTGMVETFVRHAKVTRYVCYRGYEYGGKGYVDYDPPQVTVWLDSSDNAKVSAPDADGNVTLTWETRRHWLGDSLFTARRESARVVCPTCRGTGIVPAVDDSPVSPACSDCQGNGRVDKHWPRMRYLSSFDYNERAPLYFLAALPRSSRATSVDMAVQDLAPAAVHAAYARGIDVQRQGDIFAIATRYTDADIAKMANRRCRLFAWTHPAQVRYRPGELGYRRPLTARELANAKRMRRRLFREYMARTVAEARNPRTPAKYRAERRAKRAEMLAELARHTARVAAGGNVCSCDANRYSHGGSDGASGSPCQTCGLPIYYHGYTAANAERGLVRTGETLAAWYADSSRVSKRMQGYANASVYSVKYGKCYNRALQAWQRACDDTAARFKRTPVDAETVRNTLAVYGTAHTATEVAITRNGATYMRGIMRHVPGIDGTFRERDHAPVALGDGTVWYLAVRNTVPRQ